jgi:predicted peptidase
MYFTSIDKLIREVPQLYRADENNIFLTGISMGDMESGIMPC